MVRPDHVDLDELQGWLVARLGPVAEVGPLGAGAWSLAFAVRLADGTELVARCGPHLDDFEADAHAAPLGSEALPVPRTLLVEPGPGGFVSMTTRAHGAFLETLDAEGWERAWPSVEAGLRALWAVDVAALPAGASARFGADRSWPGFLRAVDADPEGGRLAGARQRLAAQPAAERTFATGVRVLQELAATPAITAVDDDRRLVHSDLLNRNVLVQHDRLTGVFDWGCAIVGDPLYELAWMEVWAPWHPGLAALDVRARAADLLAVLGADDDALATRWRACALHIGLSHFVYNAGIGDLDALEDVRARTEAFL